MLLRLFPALAMVLVLTGCAPDYVTRCPALVKYTPEFNTALADELDAAGRPPHVETAIGDYTALRDGCKAAGK